MIPIDISRLADFQLVTLEHSDKKLIAHNPKDCADRERCAIHKRSDHPMRAFPQHWRNDRDLMERICPHGVGHPDPDHMWWILHHYGEERALTEAVHGCDGCCLGRPWATT